MAGEHQEEGLFPYCERSTSQHEGGPGGTATLSHLEIIFVGMPAPKKEERRMDSTGRDQDALLPPYPRSAFADE
jgi:hypothetical protein